MPGKTLNPESGLRGALTVSAESRFADALTDFKTFFNMTALTEILMEEPKMRRIVVCGLLAALAALCAVPAQAATANFQGFCENSVVNGTLTTDCVFDPTRTPTGQTGTACPNSSIRKYFIDFGDGSSTFYVPPPHQKGHTYIGPMIVDICLTVFCNDGTTSPTTCHCMSNNIGFGGCILPGSGWKP
jgi:hypothetical protein